MSFNTRLKERREYLGISRAELARKLDITVAAIGNYENGISSPREEILYKIFDALDVEPNYLWQDEMNTSGVQFTVSYPEREILENYRKLDERGRSAVNAVLMTEVSYMNLDGEVALSLAARNGDNAPAMISEKEKSAALKVFNAAEQTTDL